MLPRQRAPLRSMAMLITRSRRQKARVDEMHSRAENIKVKTIITQINILRENKEIYKSVMGTEKYQEKMVRLTNQMPVMGETEMSLT